MYMYSNKFTLSHQVQVECFYTLIYCNNLW